jgi:hypothetical protein
MRTLSRDGNAPGGPNVSIVSRIMRSAKGVLKVLTPGLAFFDHAQALALNPSAYAAREI